MVVGGGEEERRRGGVEMASPANYTPVAGGGGCIGRIGPVLPVDYFLGDLIGVRFIFLFVSFLFDFTLIIFI